MGHSNVASSPHSGLKGPGHEMEGRSSQMLGQRGGVPPGPKDTPQHWPVLLNQLTLPGPSQARSQTEVVCLAPEMFPDQAQGTHILVEKVSPLTREGPAPSSVKEGIPCRPTPSLPPAWRSLSGGNHESRMLPLARLWGSAPSSSGQDVQVQAKDKTSTTLSTPCPDVPRPASMQGSSIFHRGAHSVWPRGVRTPAARQ